MRNYDECQAYVGHLLAEHRHLHQMLLRARKTIAGSGDLGREDWATQVVKVLRDVRGELQSHFAEEEEGGCLNEAVSFLPNLSADMRRIEAEHPGLLAEIDRLISQVQDCQTLPDRLALETRFDELCQNLHAHETAENALLSQGFGTNINGDDELMTPAPDA